MHQNIDPMINSLNEQTTATSEMFHMDQTAYSTQTIPNEIATLPPNNQGSESIVNPNND